MTTKDLDIEDWNPDFDNGKQSIWSAEWYGPEEPLDEDQLKDEFLTMTYNNKDTYRWYYPQILECVEKDSVEEFLKDQNITDVSVEDKTELLDFFKHWIWFTSMDSSRKPQAPATFEANDVIENIGDDLLEEIDEEYAKLGKESNLTQSIKRTLH